MPTQDQISPGFGANEWMVEEMRAAWSADPSSVSPQWRELFETDPGAGLYQPGPASSNGSASSAAGGPRRATITPQAASTLRRSSAVQDVTRSDLPPAPPSDTAPPTSPYAQRQAAHPAHDQDTHVSLVPYLLARDALHLLGCPVNTAVPPPGSR